VEIALHELSKIYGISGTRLKQLKAMGAPIESPHDLFYFLRHNELRLGKLLSLLMDQAMREDLHRRIQFICHHDPSRTFQN